MRITQLLQAACLGLIAMVCAAAQASDGRKMNVLFIAIDDLRPQLGCYGDPLAKTPNMDRLAARGMVFTRAYCQQAVCSPSRTSLLTGRRPDTTRIYELQTHFRKTIPDVVTLPQCFKQNGYHVQGLSKLYHGGLDDPASWTVPHWTPKAANYASKEGQAVIAARQKEQQAGRKRAQQRKREVDPKTGTVLYQPPPRNRVKGLAWEAPDVPDNALPDGQTADKAVEVLREIKDKPFFLAVGFLKPHLPFIAPKKYYDRFSLDAIKLPDNPSAPKDVPELALTTWGELRGYANMPKSGPLSDQQTRELIRGYYAATSYTDAQVGRVLDELDRLHLRDNTVVVLWGDHGWQLGEHGLWCKHTNFELATRAPLLVSAPGMKAAGRKTAALTEFVDIYPTLVELCGLPMPEGLEGTSLAPLLNEPDRAWKPAAFSQYPRGKVMGYTMRTDRYRYTEWAEPGRPPVGVELYDHQVDPGENVNVAGLPENKELVSKLAAQLHAGWKAARPAK